jgi:methyl-accepting chemotaxis protein
MRLLAEQTNLIYNHPLTVSNAVLRINANIIKIHRSMKDIALVQDNDGIKEHSNIVVSLE